MREAERIAKEAGITLFRADTNFDNAYMQDATKHTKSMRIS